MDHDEKLWWEAIRAGRCPICLAKDHFHSGPIPVVICSCGNCRCKSCIEARDREMKGLPPIGQKTLGGIIVPSKSEIKQVETDGFNSDVTSESKYICNRMGNRYCKAENCQYRDSTPETKR